MEGVQEFTETVEQQMKWALFPIRTGREFAYPGSLGKSSFCRTCCNLELTYSLQISPRSGTAVCNVSLSGSAIARRP